MLIYSCKSNHLPSPSPLSFFSIFCIHVLSAVSRKVTIIGKIYILDGIRGVAKDGAYHLNLLNIPPDFYAAWDKCKITGTIVRIPAGAFPSGAGEFGTPIESISRICVLDIEVTTFTERRG